jgi:BirA family transcriptional regulator, biotin operon repressor / biotin---[acetyl-CoA-carboxylase] ligase
MSDPLPDELEAALRTSAGRRGHFGSTTVFFEETGSTNNVAASLAEAGAPEGTTVVASTQLAGRGRLGRQWFSPPGAGLYASVICDGRAVPFITLAGGVAVAEGIQRATGLPVTIKWPNDIVISDRLAPGGRRKLAGILAEASTGAEGLQYVVLGFGINLQRAAYPADIADRVTSLETELGRPVEAGAVLAETLAALNDQMSAIAAGRAAQVLDRWRALAPSAVGKPVEWTASGARHRGITSGIDHDGALLVRVGTHQVERIIAGEVSWLS